MKRHIELSAVITLLLATATTFAQKPTVIPAHSDGIYKAGEKVSWVISSTNCSSYKAKIKKNDSELIWEGTVKLTDGKGTLETKLDEPGMLMAVIYDRPDTPKKYTLAGAAVTPFKIPVSAPRPKDFDKFWNNKIKTLKAIPAKPVLESVDCGNPEVEYKKITMNNINGSHVYGQIAKPAKKGKYPAMLIVQWAGVYGLPKHNVVNPAKQGWLALNIMAHDLPFDKPKEFYDKEKSTTLRSYTAIGNDSRETSYFLRMFLGCYRAADYLAEHPEWNGKTMIVTGTSQGGLQGFVTAGLHPAITAMAVNVPAGCDTTAPWIGRSVAWPYWKYNTKGKDEKKVMETSRYFDAVNFAYNIKCPSLVAIGMIDQTSTPAGVLAAFNQIKGPKEAVMMINSPHQNKNNSQAPWRKRSGVWFNALLKGQVAPVNKLCEERGSGCENTSMRY